MSNARRNDFKISEKKNILLCMLYPLQDKRKNFNLGPAFISAVLKQNCFNVKNFVWDTSSDLDYNITCLKNAITDFNIDVVMLGGNLFDLKELNCVFETSKSVSPSIITIQGGIFVSYSPVEAMKLIPACDIGVIGEGEITICELMHVIENGVDINSVKAIVHRIDGELHFTGQRLERPDLATLPIPDYEGFLGDKLNGNALFVISGRSCNYSCTFCTKLDKQYRERPIEKVFEELDYYTAKYKFDYIVIINECFNTDEKYLNYFCDRISEYGIPFGFQTRLSSDLTFNVLKKLKAAGLNRIQFGLESADNTVLKSMKKGTTAELMLRVLKDVKAAQLDANGSFIFGDTIETKETTENTINFIKNHLDLFFNINTCMIRLFPGSALYNKAVKEGKIEPLSHIQNQCPLVNVSKLSDEEYKYYTNYFDDFFEKEIMRDFNVEDITIKHIENSCFSIKYSCVSCGETDEFVFDVLEQKSIVFNCAPSFFCKCGERLRIFLYDHMTNSDRIIKMIKEHKTAFYGIGYIFKRVYLKCGLSQLPEDSYYLVNRSAEKQAQIFNEVLKTNMKILPPDSIDLLNIEKVIVTIGSEYDVESIVSDLKQKYPNTDFCMWYEV